MIIDFSSRPPTAEFHPQGKHLDNYRRVYRSSEDAVKAGVRPVSEDEALAEYLAMYRQLGARAVVLKARDLRSTFGLHIPNEVVARFCATHGAPFIGFAGVDPHRGADAVSEFVDAITNMGLKGLNVQGFEHKLPINDPLLYPLYEKCAELDVPVNIHCGVNFSTHVPMSLGRPELLDQVLIDFPTLRVCASPPGWPWINELIAVAWRHPNLSIGVVAVRPKYLNVAHSGYEGLLQYGKTILKDRILFGSGFPMMPVARSIEEIRALPFPEDIADRWLYHNARNFLRLTDDDGSSGK
jgi:predicted TIM-barrel fold metal-dependent hydrolase